jgi:hypothetical protein
MNASDWAAQAPSTAPERLEQFYRFVGQADAAWDREMARESAGTCRDVRTYDQNMCLGREVELIRVTAILM